MPRGWRVTVTTPWLNSPGFDFSAIRRAIRDDHTSVAAGACARGGASDQRSIRWLQEHVDPGDMIDVEEHELAAVGRQPIVTGSYTAGVLTVASTAD